MIILLLALFFIAVALFIQYIIVLINICADMITYNYILSYDGCGFKSKKQFYLSLIPFYFIWIYIKKLIRYIKALPNK